MPAGQCSIPRTPSAWKSSRSNSVSPLIEGFPSDVRNQANFVGRPVAVFVLVNHAGKRKSSAHSSGGNRLNPAVYAELSTGKLLDGDFFLVGELHRRVAAQIQAH